MAPRELVRSGKTVEGLVRAIADDIVSGKLRPGARLDENSLALRYDVSRTPVREALGQLGAIGLIDRRPNRGAAVAMLSDDHLHSMFEAMTELEAICARLSAERMTTAERNQLDALHQTSMRLVHLGAEDEYALHNVEFHTRLYNGAHNAHIYELVSLTRSRLAPFRRAQFRIPGRLAKSWDEHDAIVTAIMRADAAGAEAAARAHVAIVSDASSEFVHSVQRVAVGS
ncbi:MAG: GntR family transcriptional regulator [Devosia sp.]|nr:GntR family transcriptional regulator [Devosia sp.]